MEFVRSLPVCHASGKEDRNALAYFELSQLEDQQRNELECSEELAEFRLLRRLTQQALHNENFAKVKNENKADELFLMPNSMKQKLDHFVPTHLKQRFPLEYELLKLATWQHYQQTLSGPVQKLDLSYQNAGRTQKYRKFLSTRQSVSKKLLITKAGVRAVLAYAVISLPRQFFTLKDIERNFRTLSCLQGLGSRKALPYVCVASFVKKEIRKMNDYLRWIWYPKLISILKPKLRSCKVPFYRLLRCMQALIRREIKEIKMIWLTTFLNEISNLKTLPLLRFQLEIKSFVIQLNPDLSTVIEMYAELAKKIANVGVEKLASLRTELDFPWDLNRAKGSYINLKLDEIYMAEYLAALKATLLQVFQPLQQYLESFRANYSCMLEMSDFAPFDFNTVTQPPFFQYSLKMMKYWEQRNELQLLPQVECFFMATVLTTPAVSTLVKAAEHFTTLVANEITAQHIRFLNSICNDYEQIKNRLSKKPLSTEELLDIKRCMNDLKSGTFLPQLAERVQYARQVGNQLQRLTEFSQNHWNLYHLTLNWPEAMEVVFDECALQIKHFTEVFKQHLEVIISKTYLAIEDLMEKIVVLNHVKDIKQLESGEYAVLFKNILATLNEFDESVKWINKEERLLELAVTYFPKLIEAKNFVLKFCKKMNLEC